MVDIDYSSKCLDIAGRTDGLSGREISKLGVAWQVCISKAVLIQQVSDSLRFKYVPNSFSTAPAQFRYWFLPFLRQLFIVFDSDYTLI